MEKVINYCFWIVANALKYIAKKTNLTYNEINILVYYLLVPLTWAVMLDLIVKLPIFTPFLLIVWGYIFITRRKRFRQWCDVAFQKSVDFLLWFQRIGWNYYKASVIICVVLILLIYLGLGIGLCFVL